MAVTGRIVVAGRYAVREVLERRQHAERFLASDLNEGDEVIVEMADIGALPAATLLRIESEVNLLSRVDSPCLTTVRRAGRDHERLFVVLPRPALASLDTRLHSDTGLPLPDVLAVGVGLLQAVVDLHQAGVIHTAIRPDHVFVGPSPIRVVVLGGLGFGRVAQLFGPTGDEPVSVLQYLSPEQAGLTARLVDERSDLYSVGLVLFESATGRPAFEARSRRELLQQQLSTAPPPVRSLRVGVPRILDEFLLRLLRKDPNDRYQSARAALDDLQSVRRALERGVVEPTIVLGASDVRQSLLQPVLVGREYELGTLESHVEQAKTGTGGLVLVEGKSGDGKTRLLDELAVRSEARGVATFRGEASERVGQRPFAAFAGVVRDLASTTGSDPRVVARLRGRLGDRADAACQALPELADVLAIETGSGPGPEAHGEARSLGALAALLDGLGTRDRPALVLLDDCQAADEVTIRLLAGWQAPDPGRRRHTVVVAAFRADEEGHWALLRKVPEVARVVLPPLPADQIRRLVESMAGAVPESVWELIVLLAQGSPFMASAVLRGLVESGALMATPTGWEFDPSAVGQAQSSRGAADVLVERLRLLPEPGLTLLSAGAILGREFDVELAAELAGLPLHDAVEAVAEAQRRHLLWPVSGGSRASFVHDHVRETFLTRTAEDERRRLHQLAAFALQARGQGSSFDLAYHFDAAGEREEAFPHALAAAEQARSQYALVVAEEYYRIALRSAAVMNRDDLGRVSAGLGNVLMLRGVYLEAGEHLQVALHHTADLVEQARLEGLLGELAFKQNDARDAVEWLQRGLRRLGQPVPRPGRASAAKAAWEVASFGAGQLVLQRLSRRPAASGVVDLLAGDLYAKLAYASWVQGRILPCVCSAFRHVNLARRYEPTPTLGQAWSNLGVMVSVASPWWWHRGAAFVEHSLAVRRHLGDVWGEGQALHFYAAVLHAGGEYRAAIERCRAAVPLLERTGDRWELNSARWHMALSHYRLGELDVAVREAERVRRDGLEIGDEEAAGAAVDILARASGGNVPAQFVAPMLERAEKRTGDRQLGVAVLLAETLRLLHERRPLEAVVFAERARRLAGKVPSVYGSCTYPWFATATRLAAAEESSLAPRRRRAAIRRADRAARRALWWARLFPNELPHALREAGLSAAMQGRPRRARRLLDESLVASERQGAAYEHALSRKARGDVGVALHWDGAAQELADAQSTLERMARDLDGGRETSLTWLSLRDRLEALMDAGRQITSADSLDGVASALREAALQALRAERCVVLELPDGDVDRAVVVAGQHDGVQWNRAVVERAVHAGRPVLLAEADPSRGAGVSTDLSVLGGARSVLCAPVSVANRVTICLYAVHNQVSGLFGQDEADLAEFIVSLAAAAQERERLQQDVMARVIDAQESERARVARDLHDEIGQALTSVLLGMRLAQESLEQRPEDAGQQDARLRELVSDALRRVRGLAFELRPAILDELGLSAALRRLVREYAERHELAVDLAVDGLDGDRLLPDVDTALYRVTQEALTNVLRHAGVSECRVSVVRSGGRLRVTIEDHGHGFDASLRRPESFGLRSMTDRASLVGGHLTIDSIPGDGTVVVLEVPVA